jgi:HEAT repeat protein
MRLSGQLLTGFVLLLAAGCGPAAPTLAGGKPVGHWLTALHDPDPKERREAADKLGNVGPADAAACPALVEALRDPDAQVRGKAILGLVKCGPAAKTAVPALQDLKEHDPDAGVRDYAGKALAKIQGR